MALKQNWLSKARADFNDTLSYILEEFGKSSSEKFFADVSDTIDMLRVFPEAGPKYKNVYYHGKEVRVFHMKRSSIIYCHDEKTLYVLAFWNNRSAGITVLED